jgi:catechol 2,3-dioxygenase-like lactoylglutathione lyase family enzyme
MSAKVRLTAAVPVLASLDIERSVQFYTTRLGFTKVHAAAGVYGIVSRDGVEIHLWACSDRHIAENTGCRVHVAGIDALYRELAPQCVVHPNAPLRARPWGAREFAVLDCDGNLVTFVEWPQPEQ